MMQYKLIYSHDTGDTWNPTMEPTDFPSWYPTENPTMEPIASGSPAEITNHINIDN